MLPQVLPIHNSQEKKQALDSNAGLASSEMANFDSDGATVPTEGINLCTEALFRWEL
jgi:hypothetical protein